MKYTVYSSRIRLKIQEDFTKKAYLYTFGYNDNYLLLSIDEDLKDTILYPLVNRILKLDNTIDFIQCDDEIKIIDTNNKNQTTYSFDSNDDKEDNNEIPFVSYGTKDDYYMNTNNSINNEYDDAFVKQHKRKHSIIEDDEIIFGQNSHLGENKSTTRNIEKKINIYDYSSQVDESKNFIDKIKNIFCK